MPLLWMIDDSHDNQAVAAATARAAGWDFAGWLSGAEGIDAFAEQCADPAGLPAAVLIDFYLGDTTGDRVASALRRLAPATWPGVLIGHSSVPAMSQVIRAAGADLVLRKRADKQGLNPDLCRWLLARG